MENSSVAVSLLVPIYNVEVFFEQCLISIFEQTFDNMEIVFVNDCTPDGSVQILNDTMLKYPERKNQIKVIHNDRNYGIAKVRNTLLENASGNFIIFIDSDDWIEKNMIERMYSKAIDENADIVGCDYYISYQNKETHQHENYSNDHDENLKRIISLDIGAYLFKILVKRDLYISNRITFTEGINVGEDYIVSVKLYYFSKVFVSMAEAYYHYVQYNPCNYSRLSISNIHDRINAVNEVERFCENQKIKLIFQKYIDGRKLIIKNPFLFDKEYIDYKKWAKLFPEANYAWRQFHFRLDYKMIYWLAEHNLFALVDSIKYIKKLLKK